jgi:hypothetical protein
MVMHSVEGEYGHELDTMSYYEFRDLVRSSSRMPQSDAVTQSLETLRNAVTVEDIGGRERLAETQHHLVDLLGYLEEKEGYSLFDGERLKCTPAPQATLTTPRKQRRRAGGATPS